MRKIRVEVLFAPGCPNADAARDAVERAARAAGVAVDVARTPVVDQAEAHRHRFPGSPTIRVDGRDVEPGVEALEQYGLG